jgi:hypothetical protein
MDSQNLFKLADQKEMINLKDTGRFNEQLTGYGIFGREPTIIHQDQITVGR